MEKTRRQGDWQRLTTSATTEERMAEWENDVLVQRISLSLWLLLLQLRRQSWWNSQERIYTYAKEKARICWLFLVAVIVIVIIISGESESEVQQKRRWRHGDDDDDAFAFAFAVSQRNVLSQIETDSQLRATKQLNHKRTTKSQHTWFAELRKRKC